jgi:hypothetical protein
VAALHWQACCEAAAARWGLVTQARKCSSCHSQCEVTDGHGHGAASDSEYSGSVLLVPGSSDSDAAAAAARISARISDSADQGVTVIMILITDDDQS